MNDDTCLLGMEGELGSQFSNFSEDDSKDYSEEEDILSELQMTLDWDKILSWVLEKHLVVSKGKSEEILKIKEDYFQILLK